MRLTWSALRRGVLRMGAVAIVAVAIPASGCAALLEGVHDASATFPVIPAGTTFHGWTEMTLDENIDSVGTTTLVAVTLSLDPTTGPPDFSFLESLSGTAAAPTGPVLVATLNPVPRGEQAVVMTIVYTGDLHPLFENANTIHIDWTGSLNPSYKGWPAGNQGFEVTADVQVDVQ
jgi:hypothetical protein